MFHPAFLRVRLLLYVRDLPMKKTLSNLGSCAPRSLGVKILFFFVSPKITRNFSLCFLRFLLPTLWSCPSVWPSGKPSTIKRYWCFLRQFLKVVKAVHTATLSQNLRLSEVIFRGVPVSGTVCMLREDVVSLISNVHVLQSTRQCLRYTFVWQNFQGVPFVGDLSVCKTESLFWSS